MKDFYFAQFTDIHVSARHFQQGREIIISRQRHQIEMNFKEAIRETNRLKPSLAFVLCTGDMANAGQKDMLCYSRLVKSLKVRHYDVPASHDLARGPLGNFSIEYFKDSLACWERRFGPARHSFEHKGEVISKLALKPHPARWAPLQRRGPYGLVSNSLRSPPPEGWRKPGWV